MRNVVSSAGQVPSKRLSGTRCFLLHRTGDCFTRPFRSTLVVTLALREYGGKGYGDGQRGLVLLPRHVPRDRRSVGCHIRSRTAMAAECTRPVTGEHHYEMGVALTAL